MRGGWDAWGMGLAASVGVSEPPIRAPCTRTTWPMAPINAQISQWLRAPAAANPAPNPLQVATREARAKPALDGIADRIQKVLERVCREVAATAALYQESIRDPSELADTTGVELGGCARAGAPRPMVVIKAEKLERAKSYARAMQEVQLLGNFVRLADYLFTEGVIERALTGGEELVAALAAHRTQVRACCSS